ncbi:HepT-like ribonuclease domain-containing protein [Arcanobacterium hippocoleae]|uniref:HepT-like ribonuclease domain-containing protein n=1 Tax=Arcanobacterium hippocoleae TaxID=149017 RepID=UPI0033413FBD
MSRTAEECLKDALLHIAKIERYTKRNLNDDAILDAIALRIASLVDTLAGLPEPMRDEMFPGVWNAMRGLRNRVAHGYQAVNPEVLKLTARLDIPLVK